MLLAAHLAGLAFATTGLGTAHAIGHALSARYGTPHGVALAAVLPLVVAPERGRARRRDGAHRGGRGRRRPSTSRTRSRRCRSAAACTRPCASSASSATTCLRSPTQRSPTRSSTTPRACRRGRELVTPARRRVLTRRPVPSVPSSAMATTTDTLEVKLLHPDARPPARTRPGDAGFDLRCVEAFALAPGRAARGADRRRGRAARGRRRARRPPLRTRGAPRALRRQRARPDRPDLPRRDPRRARQPRRTSPTRARPATASPSCCSSRSSRPRRASSRRCRRPPTSAAPTASAPRAARRRTSTAQ